MTIKWRLTYEQLTGLLNIKQLLRGPIAKQSKKTTTQLRSECDSTPTPTPELFNTPINSARYAGAGGDPSLATYCVDEGVTPGTGIHSLIKGDKK